MEEENIVNNEVVEDITTPEEVVEVVEEAPQDNEETKAQGEQGEPDIDKLVEEKANKLMEEKIGKRLARERAKHERELSKYKELGRIVESGLGVGSIDDAITQTKDFYTSQGIDISDPSKEWEEQVLGRADAEKIASYGYEEMEAEANRLSAIPKDKMTIREREMFNTLCLNLIDIQDEEELKAQGVDTGILHNEDFKNFRSQFNSKAKVSDIYKMYNKMTGNEKQIPASPGSAKTSTPVSQVADYISPDDYDKLTDEQLNDPRIMAIIDKSRQSWYKE